MKFITISKARVHLSELARGVSMGEEIVITQRGAPVMKLVRAGVPGRRPIGADEGSFTVPDSFDDPIDWAAPQGSNR